jgi:hypothetical protein
MGEEILVVDQETVKQLRVSIDEVIKASKALADTRPPKGGAEMTLVYRNLQMAKMWCGKVLEEMGSQLPAEFRDEAK